MQVNLLTSWYKSYRDEENEACLMANIENPMITNITLLCEKGKKHPVHGIPEYEKIKCIKIDHRPTYHDFFLAANSGTHKINIIANADIYFDSSLGCLKYLKENECYALTRWDDTLKGCFFYNRWDSQDVWIFKGMINGIKGDFEVGRLGCDNRIAYELKQSGYDVKNPSLTIKAHHLHLEERIENGNHDKKKTIPPPYEYVLPSEIKPFISIVTRHLYTRPNMFKNCCDSVAMQKDQDFEHVVITDNEGIGSAKANGLFNKNKDQVKGEYVFMLDDDDVLISDEFIGDMKQLVKLHNPEIIFVRMLINDELYPTEMDWKKPRLYQNHIGTSNIVVRNDLWQKYIHCFIEAQVGDFVFINEIYKTNPRVCWQDKIYSKTVKVSKGASE